MTMKKKSLERNARQQIRTSLSSCSISLAACYANGQSGKKMWRAVFAHLDCIAVFSTPTPFLVRIPKVEKTLASFFRRLFFFFIQVLFKHRSEEASQLAYKKGSFVELISRISVVQRQTFIIEDERD